MQMRQRLSPVGQGEPVSRTLRSSNDGLSGSSKSGTMEAADGEQIDAVGIVFLKFKYFRDGHKQ